VNWPSRPHSGLPPLEAPRLIGFGQARVGQRSSGTADRDGSLEDRGQRQVRLEQTRHLARRKEVASEGTGGRLHIPDLKLPGEMLDPPRISLSRNRPISKPPHSRIPTRTPWSLLKSNEARKPIVAPKAPRPTNLVNLMDALRKSIDSEKPVASKKGSVQDECRSIRCQRRRDGV